MRVLVTAGPTREPLDAVRFLSSGATGRMGIEVALAAVQAGHDVVLVLGPTHLERPSHPRLEVRPVTTALEMLAACRDAWPRCDALVATAAVSDFRPAAPVPGKPEKPTGPVTLALLPNPDILAELAADKGRRTVIGFALQVEDAEIRAREKMRRKNLDAVVLDDPAALGAESAHFRILTPDGRVRVLAGCSKSALARDIVALL